MHRARLLLFLVRGFKWHSGAASLARMSSVMRADAVDISIEWLSRIDACERTRAKK
jgi:hypothetical protein